MNLLAKKVVDLKIYGLAYSYSVLNICPVIQVSIDSQFITGCMIMTLNIILVFK